MSASSHSNYEEESDVPFTHLGWMGTGAVGAVDKVTGTAGQLTGQIFARKRIQLSNQSTQSQDRETELRAIENEVDILKRANHQHVIQLIATYLCENSYAIVMAPCAQQNLEQYFQSAASLTKSKLEENSHWFACLINGLDHIHQLGIQHRDIKPTNILIHDNNVLLADFGISTVGPGMTRTTELDKPRARTPAYCAPEVEEGHTRSQAADIFSIGAVLLELICVHFHQSMLVELRSRIQSPGGFAYAKHASPVVDWIDDLLPGPHGASPWHLEVISTCRRMLGLKPEQRPSSADVKARWSLAMPPGRCGCTPSELVQELKLNHDLKKAYAKGWTWASELLIDRGAVLSPSETLVAAAEGGLEDMVEDLLQRDHHLLDRHGAIHKASRGGFQRIVQLLLDDGVDVNEKDDDQITALCEASRRGHKDIIVLLLEHGADINLAGPGKQTALSAAAENGFDNVMKLLLQQKPHDMSVALEKAAENGHEAIVKLLLESKTDDHKGAGWLQEILFKAAARGHIPVVRLLLQRGTDVNMGDSEGSTAMHKAAANGNKETVQLLLERGVKIDAQDSAGDTALHAAAGGGYDLLVKLLLDQGFNAHITNRRGLTALGTSVEKRREGVVQALLRYDGPGRFAWKSVPPFFYAGSRVASLEVRRVITCAEALVAAAENRYEDLVTIFLNEAKIISFAALLLAVKRGNKAAVKIMLANDIKIFTVTDRTQAFALAMSHGRFGSGDDAVKGDGDTAEARRNEMMALLFDNQAFAEDQDQEAWTTLHKAASAGYDDLCQVLLESGLDANKKDNKGWTPLHAAAANGNDGVYNTLLKHGAFIDPKDAKGETPLSIVAGRGRGWAMRKLIVAGANPHAKDENKQTILYKTAGAGLWTEISLLLKARVYINGWDTKNRTPLFEASARGHPKTVGELIKGGAKVNWADIVQVTPLHMAARHGHKEVVERLLEGKAKVDLKDFGNETALHKAAENGHLEVVDMLLKHGASPNVKNRGGKWVRKKGAKKKGEAFKEALAYSGLDTGPDDDGRETPLHKAGGKGYAAVTGLLLNAGANAYAKNQKGQTALDKADINGHRHVGRVFLGWAMAGSRPLPTTVVSDTD